MSNILAMPLVRLTIVAGNNEDWVDSLLFLVDTGVVDLPQLDIRGIVFDMEIRRSATDHEVVLAASTNNGTLLIGDAPNFGYLIIQIPLAEMRTQVAGIYVGDIVGRDEQFNRVIASIDLTIVEGVTKQPVNKRIIVEAPV